MKGRQVVNGETVYIRSGEGVREVCCDCSLSHFIIYRISGKRIAMTIFRDDADTKRRRRKK